MPLDWKVASKQLTVLEKCLPFSRQIVCNSNITTDIRHFTPRWVWFTELNSFGWEMQFNTHYYLAQIQNVFKMSASRTSKFTTFALRFRPWFLLAKSIGNEGSLPPIGLTLFGRNIFCLFPQSRFQPNPLSLEVQRVNIYWVYIGEEKWEICLPKGKTLALPANRKREPAQSETGDGSVKRREGWCWNIFIKVSR